MAVIAQKRNEAAEAAPSAAALDGSPGLGGQVQEARGMRHGQGPRSANAPAGQAPMPRSGGPRGTTRGTAMDALQIFGALAGGS